MTDGHAKRQVELHLSGARAVAPGTTASGSMRMLHATQQQ